MRKEKQYHFIYKVTNLINRKFYIGMHSTDNLNDGYLGSGNRISRSIKKYGKENFKLEILEFLIDRQLLSQKEKELITEITLQDPLCMNLRPGGEGGFISDENQLRRSIAGNAAQKRLRKTNLNWVAKRSKKISKSQKELYKSGKRKRFYFYDWTNKHHNSETIKKLSEKAKLRIGNKNSQFNTCWITNGKENKKIKKQEIIPEGWNYGRN